VKREAGVKGVSEPAVPLVEVGLGGVDRHHLGATLADVHRHDGVAGAEEVFEVPVADIASIVVAHRHDLAGGGLPGSIPYFSIACATVVGGSAAGMGAAGAAKSNLRREAQLHDFIHNRVLFKLRHRVGAKILERETNPDKLKELTLCAAFLARVGYVDENFLPQEKEFIQKLLREVWGISPSLAEAVCGVAMEAANSLDLFRLIQETKATLSVNKRKTLLEALFALALAEGKMTGEEIEEIRKIAYGLEFTHREFINAKLKVLGRDQPP